MQSYGTLSLCSLSAPQRCYVARDYLKCYYNAGHSILSLSCKHLTELSSSHYEKNKLGLPSRSICHVLLYLRRTAHSASLKSVMLMSAELQRGRSCLHKGSRKSGVPQFPPGACRSLSEDRPASPLFVVPLPPNTLGGEEQTTGTPASSSQQDSFVQVDLILLQATLWPLLSC